MCAGWRHLFRDLRDYLKKKTLKSIVWLLRFRIFQGKTNKWDCKSQARVLSIITIWILRFLNWEPSCQSKRVRRKIWLLKMKSCRTKWWAWSESWTRKTRRSRCCLSTWTEENSIIYHCLMKEGETIDLNGLSLFKHIISTISNNYLFCFLDLFCLKFKKSDGNSYSNDLLRNETYNSKFGRNWKVLSIFRNLIQDFKIIFFRSRIFYFDIKLNPLFQWLHIYISHC